MRSVPFSSVKHMRYYMEQLPAVPQREGMKGIVCETDQGEPGAICLMEGWTTNSVWVHLAVTKPMALRYFLSEVANYIFNICDRKVIYGNVPSDNRAAIKLNLHLGYEIIHREKDFYEDGVDSIIFRMRRDECRFLPAKSEAA